MIHMTEEGDRKFTIAVWIIEEIIFAIMFWTVAADIARGLRWHPAWYLEATCIAFALISCVIPVLRLVDAVKMPWWFNFLLMADVYVYTISLCLGFYMDPDIPWWGFFGHVLSSMSVGAIVFLALCLIEKHSPAHVTLGSNAAIHCYTLMISLAFGGIWEVMEGYVDVLPVAEHIAERDGLRGLRYVGRSEGGPRGKRHNGHPGYFYHERSYGHRCG